VKLPRFLRGQPKASLAPELLSICWLELKMNFNSANSERGRD
jgi:hypothetical protein